MPQPHLNTPAEQAVGTNAPALPSSAGGITAERARQLLGTDLVGSDERPAGEVDDFLVDGSGTIRAAVIEWGGFLGLGERKAVVPLESIRFGGENDKGRLVVSRDQLEQLPRYASGRLDEYQARYGWSGLRTLR